jgi:hypothetical protein
MEWRALKSKAALIWLGSGLALLIAAGLIYNISRPDKLAANPAIGAAVTTFRLIDTVNELQKSFSQMNNPGQITDQYLGYMKAIQEDCRTINRYQAAIKQVKVSDATVLSLTNSVALCKDLTKLAADSSKIYSPSRPILSASTSLKRYQTFSVFKNRIRNQHVKAVNQAISQLKKVLPTIEFPSTSLTQLKQLQTNIKSSRDVAYLPGLQSFQSQLLAERHQYWTEYGDLPRLTQSLESQSEGYCQNLQQEGIILTSCQ